MAILLNYGVREEERQKTLSLLSLHELRDIGRAVGVQSPTTRAQANLLAAILDVEYGRVAPTTSRRGRKPKSKAVEPETAQAAEGKHPAISRTVRGLVSLSEGGGATLTAEWLPHASGPLSFALAENVQVPGSVALEAALRPGDVVVGIARSDESGQVSLYSVGSINGRPLEESKNRDRIQSAFGGYPSKKFTLSGAAPILRAADLFAPLGKGGRSLTVTPSQTETDKILREMLKGLCAQTAHVFVLFNEEYPEDAAEFCEGLSVTPVLLEYGKPASQRAASIRILFEHCKRLAEGGDDAVLVIPSLAKLAITATEASGFTDLCPASYQLAKEIFGSASTLTGGGSLTVLTGAVLSPADDVASAAYRALAGAASMQFALTRKEGKTVVDMERTFTKKAEKLLSEQEFSLAEALRERALSGDTDFFALLLGAQSYEDAIAALSANA